MKILSSSRDTYEEGQDCRCIEAKAKGLDPQEGDTWRLIKLATGHIVLAPVAGDDCCYHVAQQQGYDHLQHTCTHLALSMCMCLSILETVCNGIVLFDWCIINIVQCILGQGYLLSWYHIHSSLGLSVVSRVKNCGPLSWYHTSLNELSAPTKAEREKKRHKG